MKLHLPTALFALAVLPAVAFAEESSSTKYAEVKEAILNKDSSGDTYINVGFSDVHGPLAMDHDVEFDGPDGTKLPGTTQIVWHDGNLELKGNDRVGVCDGPDGALKTSYASGEQSNTLYVTGDVSIKDNAKVYLLGQNKGWNSDKGIWAACTYNTGGMEVDGKLTVEGGTVNLASAKFDSLAISGGEVRISQHVDNGAPFLDGYGHERGGGYIFRSGTISDEVNVSGNGKLYIGRGTNSSSAKYSHERSNYYQSIIGGPIKQSGANSVVKLIFNTYITSNLIEQKDGWMELGYFSEGETALDHTKRKAAWLRFNESEVSINQDNGTLYLGGIIIKGDDGKGDMKLNISQTGEGTIWMAAGQNGSSKTWKEDYLGSEFKSGNGASLISQSGKGHVNIHANYSSATFNVEQTGTGTITIGEHGVLKSSALTLTDAAKFSVVNGGKLKLEDATLSYTVTDIGSITSSTGAAVYNEGAVVSMIDSDSGSVSGSIVSVGVALSDEAFAAYTVDVTALSIDVELTSFTVTLATGLTEKAVTFNPDEVGITTEATYTVGGESVTVAYDVKEVNVVNGNLVATVGATVKSVGGGNVPEPATATLSLLALAGLCARRRRK